MLPWHMLRSLEAEGLQPLKIEDGHLASITQALALGRPVIAFLGCGVGHWVTIWGYDEENFYMFDNRLGVTRDEHGLTTMSQSDFMTLWEKIPLVLRPLTWLSTSATLRVAPRTMIIPW